MAEVTAYYAVPAPDDPSVMTYWRRNRKGQLHPWPQKAQYGPMLRRSDIPADLRGRERHEWGLRWMREVRTPWWQAVQQQIIDDPEICMARFAEFATRCCQCGRALTDPESKVYGIGPECRTGLSETMLAAMAERVGRAHGQARNTGEVW